MSSCTSLLCPCAYESVIHASGLSTVITCANVPILSIPNFNLYQQFILEVDSRMGQYSECNPNPQTGVFACSHYTHHSSHGGRCWYDDPTYASSFASACSRSNCSCDAITTDSVGRELIAETMGHGALPNTPVSAKCKAAVTSACGKDAGHQQVCMFCVQLHARTLEQSCTQQELQMEIFQLCIPSGGGGGGHGGSSGMVAFQWTGALAKVLNGTWYSTQEAGMCAEGQRPGDGSCWWRLVETTRTVNATCVNNSAPPSLLPGEPSAAGTDRLWCGGLRFLQIWWTT